MFIPVYSGNITVYGNFSREEKQTAQFAETNTCKARVWVLAISSTVLPVLSLVSSSFSEI
jgi:hypothetical protein